MIELIQQQTVHRRSRTRILNLSAFVQFLSLAEKIRLTPRTLSAVALLVGGLLAAVAMVYSLVPSYLRMYDEPLQLPVDNQLYTSMVNYLEKAEGHEEYGDDDLPPLASFLGGIEEQVHTVVRGDTLSGISLKYDVEVGTLISFNGIEDVRRIVPGTQMRIPSFDGVRYEVRPGDSLSSIGARNGISVNNILDANNLESALIRPGDILFLPGAKISEYDYKKATGTLIIYPTRGLLTSGYGYRDDPFTGLRRYHYGVDIANVTGTAIIASMSGVVVDIENRPAGYGKYVVIRHDRGYQTLYGHLNTISVREGQRVQQGQTIGTMGSTGRSTGPHLHFAIYKNNRPVNPLSILH